MTSPEFIPTTDDNEKLPFADKLKELLPGTGFEESTEMSQARMAVLELLQMDIQDPELIGYTWTEYSKVCEQVVDSQPDNRARLQIAILVHKALIFREVGNMQRYGEDLSDAEEYAYNMHFDEIARVIGLELDALQTQLRNGL